jgi:phosphinothricin acetyltransferase
MRKMVSGCTFKQIKSPLNSAFHIRLITPGDVEATLAIYAPYVQHTAVSFEYEVPTFEEWESRIIEYTADFPWLVCQLGNRVAGYAYAGKHRSRMAYAWSAESTIYVSAEVHGCGVAGALYEALFALLKLQGYLNVFAGITVPNARSEGFHQKLGFKEVGIYKKVGYKHGKWHDVRWLQRSLTEHSAEPIMPVSFSNMHSHAGVAAILQQAEEKLHNNRLNSQPGGQRMQQS